MAGFQVANFDFGKNIVDANLRRQQLAAQERASARSAALQARGQDIAVAQNEAARAEQARQFDARMADSQAARDESARQFDNRLVDASMARAESARQFDAGQSLREREFAAKRADTERMQSWDDALKTQQMEAMELEFAKRNEEINRIMSIRQKEDEERAHQQELIDSAYGDAVIATELGGGFLSPGQINDFNNRNGTKYNYIGKVDPTTGKLFSDGKIHFLTYATDQNGAAVIDPQSKRPVLEDDLPIGKEFYGRVMDGYFGQYKGLSSNSASERLAFDVAKFNQNKMDKAEEKEFERRKAIANRLGRMRDQKIKIAGGIEQPRYTPEEIEEEEKKLMKLYGMDSSRQGGASSGYNGSKQFKEGDEQVVNGVRMKLLPSKKNPGKLTWQRIQ